LVPSYGLAIIALTVVIRLALFPLSAGSIRSARRMRIAQPVMQKRQAEIKAKYASNPQKQQEELGKLMKEFGSPLAGCLPLVVQMPILFALFATLRGSPFADLPYTLNLKVLRRQSADSSASDPKTRVQNLVISEGALTKFDQDGSNNDQVCRLKEHGIPKQPVPYSFLECVCPGGLNQIVKPIGVVSRSDNRSRSLALSVFFMFFSYISYIA
jgi:YidC/Oxa1 family membrane protein insertase